MPLGGGSPKQLYDGMVVIVRPDFSRGNADLWETRDAVVALMEELDKVYTYFAAQSTAMALPAGSIATLQANWATLTPPSRTAIKLADGASPNV